MRLSSSGLVFVTAAAIINLFGVSATSAQDGQRREWVAYFDREVVNMTPAARDVVDLAARDCLGPFPAGSTRTIHFDVVGHADTADPKPDETSLKRALSVRDEMLVKGCSSEMISVRGAGSGEPAIKTGPGESEPLNRGTTIRESVSDG